MSSTLNRVAIRSAFQHLQHFSSYTDCSVYQIPPIAETRTLLLPSANRPQISRSQELPTALGHTLFDPNAERDDAMGKPRTISTTSSNTKRKRGRAIPYYAVKAGHKPGLYYNWSDAKEQVQGFKNAIFKKFDRLTEAEYFMMNDKPPPARPGKTKYYGVQVGRAPGIYTDWPSVLDQVTGFKGGKQKSFATWEEANAYVNDANGATPSDMSTPISLKGHLESTPTSLDDAQKGSKKQKKNDGSAAVSDTNGHFEPGTGPLPPGAEDGFDPRIKMTQDGSIANKTAAELAAHKLQPTGDFDGPISIWTDGASKNNGQIGAVAGIGIWFGPNDSRNQSEPLAGERQTNQRAELTAISRALDMAPIDRNVVIYSDSHYSIQCVTEWYKKWEWNDWKNAAGKDVENKDLIKPIRSWLKLRDRAGSTTEIIWVKGHAKNLGNIEADKLASEAALKAQVLRQLERVNGKVVDSVEQEDTD